MESQLKNLVDPVESFKAILMAEFEARKEKNARYSLRSFGRQIGISHSYLSQFLRGKTPLTPRAVRKVARHLDFDVASLIEAVEGQRATSRKLATPGAAVVNLAREQQLRQWKQEVAKLIVELKALEISAQSPQIAALCAKFEQILKAA